MEKQSFEQIFNSYFHLKYTLEEFKNTKLELSKNIKELTYTKHTFIAYIKTNKKLIPNSILLKNYHKFINSIIVKYLNVHKNVYSYKEGINLKNTLDKHKKNRYFLKMDIINFFNSVNSSMIESLIKNNSDNYPISDISKYITYIINLISFNDTLPVGFVTSSGISNAILYEFDKYISEYCKNNNIEYSRYSDDLIFSNSDYKELKKLESIVIKNLDKLYDDKLKINQEKTIYLSKAKTVNILGLVITTQGHITVNKNIKEDIKHLLYFYKNDKIKFDDFLNKKYNNSIVKAYGILNYINDIDKDFILYLRKKYKNHIIDKFLHGDKTLG